MRKVRLGDICDVLNGYAFKSSNYVLDGIRIIRITNVQKGYIADDDPKYYPIEARIVSSILCKRYSLSYSYR